jgi:hypothetical protein
MRQRHFDFGSVAFVQLDSHVRVERCGGAMERLLGWTGAEAAGRMPLDLNDVHSADLSIVFDVSKEVRNAQSDARMSSPTQHHIVRSPYLMRLVRHAGKES